MRRPAVVLVLVALLAAVVAVAGQARPRGEPAGGRRPLTVVEATIPELQTAMAQRRVTSRAIVEQYLMGGALAFDGFVPPYEATLTRNLREAGAVILAKTVMTELANWVASGMPANYSALKGYGMNPYDPRRDPREATFDGRPALATGGSSSGAGTAANFWAANIGTETSGSILSPSNQNMLVGIKPTVGRISRYGIIPITADQDTPGPMARSVTDAAILLGVLEGSPDPHDPATTTCGPPPGHDYTRLL